MKRILLSALAVIIAAGPLTVGVASADPYYQSHHNGRYDDQRGYYADQSRYRDRDDSYSRYDRDDRYDRHDRRDRDDRNHHRRHDRDGRNSWDRDRDHDNDRDGGYQRW